MEKGVEESGTGKSGTGEPGTQEPGTQEPGTEESGTGESSPATEPDRRERRALAEQLRSLGLPLMLTPADRAEGLLRRVAGVLLTTTLVLLGIGALNKADALAVERIDATNTDQLELSLRADDPILLFLSAALLLLAAAPILGWILALVLRRVPDRVATGVGLAVAVLLVIVPAVALGRGGNQPVWIPLICLVVILAAGYYGVGTVLRWSTRRVRRELWTLGPMVARVLPVLMIAFLFFFYNAEIWQVTFSLSWGRIFAVVAVMILLTIGLVVVTTGDRLRIVVEAHHDEPAGDETPDPPLEAFALRRPERLNLLAIPCLVTLIQAGLFAMLVFAFFTFFGWLSVTDPTVAQWTGQPAVRFDGLLSFLPITTTLVKVALTLAVFSALNFVASSGTDRNHDARFVEPLLDEMVHTLEVRSAYVRCAGRRGHRAAG